VTLMPLLGLLPIALCVFLQAFEAPLLQGDVLNAEEKQKLERAQNVDDRIKVYSAASKRMQQSIQSNVRKNDFSGVPEALKQWISLLSGSLEDINSNLNTRKKSKPLIKYEIQVRKSLTELKGYKTKAPVEQQDEFDSQLAAAEKIRKRLVEIIFN
jgi:hypothetical protein